MSAKLHILPQPEFALGREHVVMTPEGEVRFEKEFHTITAFDGSAVTFVTWRLA